MEALVTYENNEGVLTSENGQRHLVAQLRVAYPPLGLSAGQVVAVNVDAPLGVGDHVLVEYQGGIYLTDISASDTGFSLVLNGREWPAKRAGWGAGVPVVVGPIQASGRAL